MNKTSNVRSRENIGKNTEAAPRDKMDDNCAEEPTSMGFYRERCSTPVPEDQDSWLNAAGPEELDDDFWNSLCKKDEVETTDTVTQDKAHGLPELALSVMREYYKIGPEATRKKPEFVSFYEYLAKNCEEVKLDVAKEKPRNNFSYSSFVHPEASPGKPDDPDRTSVLDGIWKPLIPPKAEDTKDESQSKSNDISELNQGVGDLWIPPTQRNTAPAKYKKPDNKKVSTGPLFVNKFATKSRQPTTNFDWPKEIRFSSQKEKTPAVGFSRPTKSSDLRNHGLSSSSLDLDQSSGHNFVDVSSDFQERVPRGMGRGRMRDCSEQIAGQGLKTISPPLERSTNCWDSSRQRAPGPPIVTFSWERTKCLSQLQTSTVLPEQSAAGLQVHSKYPEPVTESKSNSAEDAETPERFSRTTFERKLAVGSRFSSMKGLVKPNAVPSALSKCSESRNKELCDSATNPDNTQKSPDDTPQDGLTETRSHPAKPNIEPDLDEWGEELDYEPPTSEDCQDRNVCNQEDVRSVNVIAQTNSTETVSDSGSENYESCCE